MDDDAEAEGNTRTNIGEPGFRELTANVTLPQFVVEETVAGQGGDLKEYVVGLRASTSPNRSILRSTRRSEWKRQNSVQSWPDTTI